MISVILTLTLLIYSYNTVMPRVSYIKAMDVYLGSCFFFVFFCLFFLYRSYHVGGSVCVSVPIKANIALLFF